MNYMRDQKKLHKKYVVRLLWKARDILKTLLSVVEQPIPEYHIYPNTIATKNSLYAVTRTDSTTTS
jgi:hypothetical protein